LSSDVTQIGQYLIESRIGEGGMGAVYLGRHVHLGMRAAIKTILKKALSSDDSVVRLLDEGRALAKLQHPNIVRVLDFFESGGNFYLIMEFVDGMSLKQRLEQGPVEMGEALRIARAVGTGIVAAHSQNILHRDIKPSNVMLGRTDEIKLTDFGLAKFMGATSKTKAGFVIGTPRYMAPETVRGDEVDERSDQYAFGILLYRLLAGREPFLGETPVEIMSAQVNRLPRPPREYNPHIHLQLQDLVMKALEKDPAARFPSMARLMVGLNHFTKGVITASVEGKSSAPVENPTVAIARSLEEALEPTITRGMVQVKLGEGPALEDYPPEPPVETLNPSQEVPAQKAAHPSPYMNAPPAVEKPVIYYKGEAPPPPPPEAPPASRLRIGVPLALAGLLLIGALYFGIFHNGSAPPAAAPITADESAQPAAPAPPAASTPRAPRFPLAGIPRTLLLHIDVPRELPPAPATAVEQMLLANFPGGRLADLREQLGTDPKLPHRDFYEGWLALRGGELNQCIQSALNAQAQPATEPAGRYLEGSCRLAMGQPGDALALLSGKGGAAASFNESAAKVLAGAETEAKAAAERLASLDSDVAAQYLSGRYFLAIDPVRGQRLLRNAERQAKSSSEKTEIEKWLQH
jgi:serine/threonine-protein kinase